MISPGSLKTSPYQHLTTIKATKMPKNTLPPDQRAIAYRIHLAQPEAHLIEVSCTVEGPDAAGVTFALPAWIPGSYMIRNFARHVVSFVALADDMPVTHQKIALDQWQVIPPAGTRRVTTHIKVYAWDLSVRGAHFDTSHAFFNGTSVFLRVVGREDRACTVEIAPPSGKAYAQWRIATALPRAGRTLPNHFGRYQAANYAELIDHPVEAGLFDAFEFSACGVQHDFALTGRHHANLDRLRRDLKKICAWHIEFWGRPAPMARYVFLTQCVADGYGGLEHRASTALVCKRDDLPGAADEKEITEGYRNFLALASHEYFHTWFVKRIQPAEFVDHGPLDLQHPNLTQMLWLFEGFTSYYDDLALHRCGLIDADAYLACLAKTIGNVFAAPGRSQQTVAEASYDAWIKYYKQDENSPNATVSYYTKGALVALGLDLLIRQSSNGKRSLDDLMRRLWAEFGMTGAGVCENSIRTLARELIGDHRADTLLDIALHSTDDLPVAEWLADHGIRLQWKGAGLPSLGVRLERTEPKIACALTQGGAHQAGLSGGDVLVALDGLKISTDNLERLLSRYKVGDRVMVHAFRRDELLCFAVTLTAAQPSGCELQLDANAGKKAKALRARWLQG